jgi:hypothetical protein
VHRGDKSGLSRFERRAIRLVLGHLLAYNIPADKPKDKQKGDDTESGTVADTGGNEYELSHGEEQIMRISIDGLHTAGLAMAFQGITQFISAIASLALGSTPTAVSTAYGGFNKILTSQLMFTATNALDRVVATEGSDISNMMEGLGNNGLTMLFSKLTVLSWATASAQLLVTFLPWLTNNPIVELGVTLKASGWVADVFLWLQNAAVAAVGAA